MYLFTKLLVAIIFVIFIMTILVVSNYPKEQLPNYEIKLKNHIFYPDTITIQKNQIVQLTIVNEDKNLEEFESIDLQKEKIILPMSEISFLIGPLLPGEYKYYGEFNSAAKGVIIAK
jgi:hypothetical protein